MMTQQRLLRPEQGRTSFAMDEGGPWTDAELSRLRLEGLEHLNRLQSGVATEYDRAEFLAWRSRDPAHEAAFRSALRLQRDVRSAADRAGGATVNETAVVLRFRSPPRTLDRRMLLGGTIAASLAGGLLLGRSLDLLPAPAELTADYRTRAGERRSLSLPGGARAELNTRTSIRLRDGLGYPAVDLLAGETVMTAAPGTRGRVAVFAGKGASIGRLGQFAARRDGDAVCVTCLSGLVDVHWQGERRTLRPAQDLTYDDTRIGAVGGAADLDVLTAWRSGTLIFRNMPMRTVVDEINRYRPGRILLANPALAARPLTGTYDVARLDDFFSQASLALGVRVTRLPAGVVILA